MFKPQAIFKSALELREIDVNQPFPKSPKSIGNFILSINAVVPKALGDYLNAVDFLKLYSLRSQQTFTAFRTEVERFLLWAWIIRNKSVDQLTGFEITQYVDFCINPPIEWVESNRNHHYIINDQNDEESNPAWRPFRAEKKSFNARAKTISRKLSEKTIDKQFAILNVFFKHLLETEYIVRNPVYAAKKARVKVKLVVRKDPRFFNRIQWGLILSILTDEANNNHLFERNLFAVVTLKSLYLRISEISCQSMKFNSVERNAVMSNFIRDDDNLDVVWFKAFGKGNKERLVTVPLDYLTYLERYRLSRGMETGFPDAGEDGIPLIHKLRGHGGLSVRQVTRLIQESFDLVVLKLRSKGDVKNAKYIESASTHWLRHTGATMDIDRPLKHLSEDLGHASMATTDRVYIHSDRLERSKSGLDRKV
jgi:integrase/recombinase XerD